uniref:Secreted protein n=1 Tax=Parascaris univalens TaxID=6257 RepID=A0A915BVY4_PARUN
MNRDLEFGRNSIVTMCVCAGALSTVCSKLHPHPLRRLHENIYPTNLIYRFRKSHGDEDRRVSTRCSYALFRKSRTYWTVGELF